jgi:hypothetical protein
MAKATKTNKNMIYVVVALVVVLIILGIYFLSGNKSSNTTPSNTQLNASNSAANIPADCGIVPVSYLNGASNAQKAPKQVSLACMSENLKTCKLSTLGYEGATPTTSNTFSILGESGDNCQLKYTTNKDNAATKTIICDFKKTQINSVYDSYKSKSNEYALSLAFSLLMGFNMGFNQPGQTSISYTDPNTNQKYSIPCSIS